MTHILDHLPSLLRWMVPLSGMVGLGFIALGAWLTGREIDLAEGVGE